MARYGQGRGTLTPSTSNDLFTLLAGANKSGGIREITLGGELTTSTAQSTRVARSGSQTGATTAITAAKYHFNSPAAGFSAASTFATTQPTLDAGNLLIISWNAHGGVIRWLAEPDEEMVMIGTTNETGISVRNTVGTTASSVSAGCVWREDLTED